MIKDDKRSHVAGHVIGFYKRTEIILPRQKAKRCRLRWANDPCTTCPFKHSRILHAGFDVMVFLRDPLNMLMKKWLLKKKKKHPNKI